ncbi:MAG: family 16 glycosylhydrolase [Spirochaetales bacterium]|nr:family 16 glycosylhydrolase [Spirochaetales bacterium]
MKVGLYFCLLLTLLFAGCVSGPGTTDAGDKSGKTGNLVVNGDFSAGDEHWETGLQGKAKGAVDFDSEILHANITTAGNQHWELQVTQMGLPIEEGKTYRVAFKAKASANRSIIVNVGKGSPPWTTYANNQSIKITNTMKNYSFDFEMESSTDQVARVEFNLADATGDVWIDDVSVTLATAADKEPEADLYPRNPDQWELVWSDEFDNTGLPDPKKWSFEVKGPGWVNNEKQNYTDRLENAGVKDGILSINALKDNYQGFPYSSARIITRGKGDWLYARVEVRAKLPKGRGTWPAIWMYPTDDMCYGGGWPDSGEIDIMEHVGYEQGRVHASTHCNKYYFKTNNQKTAIINVPDCSEVFHVYSVERYPDRIDIYLDDQKYFTYRNPGKDWTYWPFDKPFFLILNVAIGGDWGGIGGIDENMFPVSMEVDYVRVYDMGLLKDDNEPPKAPAGLTANPFSSSLELKWEPSVDNMGVQSYEIYRGDDLLVETTSGKAVVSGLKPETSYSFRIRAKDFNGNYSGFSEGTFTTTKLIVYEVNQQIESELYSAMSGVQTEETTDTGGGINVGWIDKGDWIEYVIHVPKAGKYQIDFRVAASSASGEAQILDEKGKVLSSTDLPVTGGWQNWETITTEPFPLPKGNVVLRVFAAKGGFNLNWMIVKPAK